MPKYSCNDSEASGWRDVFDLSTDKKISYMIEDLSAWVVIKRFLIVVDNVVAAGLFAFFSVWINVYLGLEGYVEDFGSSVSMTITDIRLNLLETLLYFSLYLVLLWRSPEKNRTSVPGCISQEIHANRTCHFTCYSPWGILGVSTINGGTDGVC